MYAVNNNSNVTNNPAAAAPPASPSLFVSSKNARTQQNSECVNSTLVLPDEFEHQWLALLARWLKNYNNPDENSLTYDFVLTAAQSDWYRRRSQRFFDEFLIRTGGLPAWSLSPVDGKQYDLMLRHKYAADRAFQREFRLLEAHCKSQRQQSAAAAAKPDQLLPHLPMLPMPTPVLRTGAEIRAKNEKYGWNRPFLTFIEDPPEGEPQAEPQAEP